MNPNLHIGQLGAACLDLARAQGFQRLLFLFSLVLVRIGWRRRWFSILSPPFVAIAGARGCWVHPCRCTIAISGALQHVGPEWWAAMGQNNTFRACNKWLYYPGIDHQYQIRLSPVLAQWSIYSGYHWTTSGFT